MLRSSQEGAVGAPEPQPSIVFVTLDLARAGWLAPDLCCLPALSLSGREQRRDLARGIGCWERGCKCGRPRSGLERGVGISLLLPLRYLSPSE